MNKPSIGFCFSHQNFVSISLTRRGPWDTVSSGYWWSGQCPLPMGRLHGLSLEMGRAEDKGTGARKGEKAALGPENWVIDAGALGSVS